MPSFPQDPNRDGKQLPIYWAEPRVAGDLDPIKAAKASLDLPFKCFPLTASPSTEGRVLAYGGRPPWLCDYALVRPGTGPERLAVALGWVLGDHEDTRATTVLDQLQAIFGTGVREIPPAELAAEERLAAYQQGLD